MIAANAAACTAVCATCFLLDGCSLLLLKQPQESSSQVAGIHVLWLLLLLLMCMPVCVVLHGTPCC
jgi:uncharacterized membrane protein